MRDTDLTGQTREGGQKLRSVPESDESTGVIKHIYMVAARSVETRSEQGAQGAVPKGATEMNCWAIRTGRTEQYVAWKDDLDHVMKINGQEDIETFLAALPPALDDEPNSETAAAKKRHAELLVAWLLGLGFTWLVVEPGQVLGLVLFPIFLNNDHVADCTNRLKDLGLLG